jgi:hypothetical protein
MQQIRKENLHVESDLNSVHQTFLYDLIYDQQDLSDFFDNISICLQENEETEVPLRSKSESLPFSHSLQNISMFLTDYNSKKSIYKDILLSIRWYDFKIFEQ